ncbi:MAG: MltA domain-containing protein [Desulfovibrio sp.]|nr:MltA domain-containing protein [Desulfovibrio sp.]
MRAASACTLLRRAGLLAVLCLGLALGACGGKKTAAPDRGGPWVAPQEPAQVFVSRLKPASQDLNSWTEMAPTIRKSESYCAKKPASALAVNRGEMKITWGEMAETLRTLRGILPKLDANPGLLLEKFRWIPFPGGIKYSSYYEPQIKASRERNPAKGHTEPMYKVPPDMAAYKVAHGGRYYSRREIDEGHLLEGKGLELAWADPVDVFFLQIQGSGKLIFGDGTEAFINYAGQNGHKYRSSGKIMAAKGGILKRGDIFEQRAWLHAHPERQKEIFNENPSYVFFKFGMRGSMGAMGYQVDDWLSLATDPRYIPLGAVVAFGVNAPDPQTGRFPLRGIGFAQDTGGAIKKDRIDIYAGGSDRGNYVASFLDASGPAWVLVRR